MKILPLSFYQQENVVYLAQQLLGKVIVSEIGGTRTSGIIVETEAYKGPEDKACHAYNNKRTPRTEPMFAEGGIAYVYLCYGIHHLFNIVTGKKDVPHAILIRAIEPLDGVEIMRVRRNKKKIARDLTAGPGCLSQALNINKKQNQISLVDQEVWLEDHQIFYNKNEIIASPRVGIDYAKEYVNKPWRFRVKDSKWTSKPY